MPRALAWLAAALEAECPGPAVDAVAVDEDVVAFDAFGDDDETDEGDDELPVLEGG